MLLGFVYACVHVLRSILGYVADCDKRNNIVIINGVTIINVRGDSQWINTLIGGMYGFAYAMVAPLSVPYTIFILFCLQNQPQQVVMTRLDEPDVNPKETNSVDI